MNDAHENPADTAPQLAIDSSATDDSNVVLDAPPESSCSGAVDAGACDRCSNVCPSGVCWDGGCFTPVTYSWYGAYDPGPSIHPVVLPGNDLAGIQLVNLPKAGLLTKLGTYVSPASPGVSYVLALYADAGGSPTKLIAQTAPFTTVVGKNEQPVDYTWLDTGFYWVMGIGAQAVALETLIDPLIERENSAWKWEHSLLSFGQSLPKSLSNPSPILTTLPPADVYAVIAIPP